MTSLRRSPDREGRWLRQAEHQAGNLGFAAHAEARLAAGVSAYGERWASLGLDRLLAELTEEAADLGGWGVLAFQALEHTPHLDAGERQSIADHVYAAIRAGAAAHQELTDACRGLAHRADVGPGRTGPEGRS
jgi:hypothetical protein